MNTHGFTELRTRKFQRLFDLHDSNGDGKLEVGDMLGVADRLSAIKGFAAGSPESEGFRQAFSAEWDELQRAADANDDKVVSREEWMSYMAKVVNDPAEYERRIVPVADMIIALVDDDADGKVTADNWGVFFSVYGIDTAPKETFGKIDKAGAGKVDRDQILGALHEYFYSSDPSAAGNWFYGTPPA